MTAAMYCYLYEIFSFVLNIFWVGHIVLKTLKPLKWRKFMKKFFKTTLKMMMKKGENLEKKT